MIVKDKELPYTLSAELTSHQVAVALTEYLIRHRGWPTDVRIDNTNLTIGFGKNPNVFTAEVSELLPEPKTTDTVIRTPGGYTMTQTSEV